MKRKENYLTSFFKTRSIGFWLFILAWVLAVANLAVYCVTFQEPGLIRYYSQNAVVISAITIAGSFVLSWIKPLSKWAPLGLFIGEFFAFFAFIEASVLYLSSNFFGGVTMGAIMGMRFGYLFTVITYVLIFIVSGIAVFLKNAKSQ